MSLLESKPIYKPFAYPWAYEAWHMQQRPQAVEDRIARIGKSFGRDARRGSRTRSFVFEIV